MRNQWLGILTGVTFLGTVFTTVACDGTKNHRIGLNKTLQGSGSTASGRTKVINDKIADKNCLRVDRLVGAFTEVADETLLVYPAGLDAGNVDQGKSGKGWVFRTTADTRIVAKALLPKAASLLGGLQTQVLAASELRKDSVVAELLNIKSLDEKCETLTLENGDVYKLLGKSSQSLTVAKEDRSEILSYSFKGDDKLIVSIHQSTGGANVCDTNIGDWQQSTFIVARGDELNKVQLDRRFAQMLVDALPKVPSELRKEVGELKNGKDGKRQVAQKGTVKLNAKAYDAALKLLSQQKFDSLTCPDGQSH